MNKTSVDCLSMLGCHLSVTVHLKTVVVMDKVITTDDKLYCSAADFNLKSALTSFRA